MASDSVYCGFWVNWDQGVLMGTTLTLPKQWGVVLIAFLALFVRFAGSHLWNIVCFTMHQIRAAPGDQDDIYHQFQVILRSGSSESRVLLDIMKIWWNRRKVTPTITRRCLPLLSIASFHMLVIGFAGLFSSRVVTTSDETLTQSASCGWLAELSRWTYLTDPQTEDTAKTLLVMGRSSYQRSSIYSRACYGEQYSDYSSICSSYVQQRINATVNISAPCPFAPGACDGPAVSMDTGFIDSDYHLGINTHKSNRMSIKKVTTCAPILSERYASGWFPAPSSDPILNDTWKAYFFGSLTAPNATFVNYTFVISNSVTIPFAPAYNIEWLNYFVGNQSETDFEPVPDFQIDNADLIIMALFNTAAYTDEVHDPWFKAQDAWNDGANTTYWIATKGYSFLGCTERYQLCSQSQCTPLTGLYDINPNNFPLSNLGQTQTAVSQLLWKAVWASQFNYGMRLLNQEVLLAKDFLWGAADYRSAPLSDTQWHDEVLNLYNVSLALLQRRVVEFASPPDYYIGPGISSLNHIVPPTGAELKLCKQIKIRTSSYSSFRVFSLFAIIALGLVIVCVNIFLSKVVQWVQKRWEKGEYKRFEWIETSGLQLQRMACEGRGIEGWIGREDDIPRTKNPVQKFSLTRLSLASVSSGPSMLPASMTDEIGRNHHI